MRLQPSKEFIAYVDSQFDLLFVLVILVAIVVAAIAVIAVVNGIVTEKLEEEVKQLKREIDRLNQQNSPINK